MTTDSCIIATFDRKYRDAFARLNYAWITQLFVVEPADQRILDNPETEIIAPGGEVFFALKGDAVIGTVALKVESEGILELTKMAVDDRERGRGYGKLLLDAALDHARQSHTKRVVLSSHTKLIPAIAMYRAAGFTERATGAESCYSRCNVYLQLDL